jgi:hypothetical protein
MATELYIEIFEDIEHSKNGIDLQTARQRIRTWYDILPREQVKALWSLWNHKKKILKDIKRY